MSHLSILPTQFHDIEGLAASLEALGLTPSYGGVLRGFADERQAVALQVRVETDLCLGWSRQPDGCLALVGDLQRLSRSHSLQGLLGRLTRAYAARMALRDAALHFAEAQVSVST